MDDLISRQAAIDAIMCEPTDAHYPSWYAERLEQLPCAQPERKRGKWIFQGNRSKTLYGWYFCSECGAYIGGKCNFCSECGADMREVSE